MDLLVLILFCESFSNTIIIFVQIFPATATGRSSFRLAPESFFNFDFWIMQIFDIFMNLTKKTKANPKTQNKTWYITKRQDNHTENHCK